MRIALLELEEHVDDSENLDTEQTIERPEVGNLNVDKVIEESKEINNSEEIRENIATESISDTALSTLKAKFSGFGYIFSLIHNTLYKSKNETIQLLQKLKEASDKYDEALNKKEYRLNIFTMSFLTNEQKAHGKDILNNIKTYSTFICDTKHKKIISQVIDSLSEIIKQVRDIWFISSGRDMQIIDKELLRIRESMVSLTGKKVDNKSIRFDVYESITGITNYHRGLIWINKSKLDLAKDETYITIEKEPIDAVVNEIYSLLPNDKDALVKELEKIILDKSISEDLQFMLTKIEHIYGSSFINGFFRVGGFFAKLFASAVAGPTGYAIAQFYTPQDLRHALSAQTAAETLGEYYYETLEQRKRIVNEAIKYILACTGEKNV